MGDSGGCEATIIRLPHTPRPAPAAGSFDDVLALIDDTTRKRSV
jgi:hypothetical protein